MRRRSGFLLLVGLALAAAAAGRLLRTRGGGDGHGAGSAADGAREVARAEALLGGRSDPGRPPASAPPPPAAGERALRGRLVTEDGDPVREPRAWLVPKGSPGFHSWHEVRARAEVARDGTWSLDVDPRGQWIAALAEGYRPAYVDGDRWDGGEVVLRLERGRRIEVSVSVETDGVEPDVAIFVHGREKDAYDYPGPGSEPAISTHESWAGRGTTVVYASMRGRVQVFAGARGFVSAPEHVELGPDEDHAAFHLCLGCRLDLRVTDAETGFPIEDDVRVRAFPADADEARGEPTVSLDRFADDMRYRGLPPGAWRVVVGGGGYVSWVSGAIDLLRPGQRVAVEASLAPAPDVGRLLLEVAPPRGGTLEGAELSAVMGRRGEDGGITWERRMPRGRSTDRRRFLFTPIAPGEVRLLAWTGPAAVGWLGPRAVEGGTTQTVRMPLVAGTFVRLLGDVNRTDGAFYSGLVLVTVRASDGSPLPAAWFESRLPALPNMRGFVTTAHDFRDELVSFYGHPRADAVLGPYPFDGLAVEGARYELVANER